MFEIYIGPWFRSIEEADEWLDFECNDNDAEYAAWYEPDHYAEWEDWKHKWELSHA
jgi:hypothetical protein